MNQFEQLPDGWVSFDSDLSRNLVDELHREICPSHKLYNQSVKAIARKEVEDDVLFISVPSGSPVYVVHLTWNIESNHQWPWFVQYDNVQDFLERWPIEEG